MDFWAHLNSVSRLRTLRSLTKLMMWLRGHGYTPPYRGLVICKAPFNVTINGHGTGFHELQRNNDLIPVKG